MFVTARIGVEDQLPSYLHLEYTKHKSAGNLPLLQVDLTCKAHSSDCLLFVVAVDIKQVVSILKLIFEEVNERRLATNGSQLLRGLVRVLIHVYVVAVDGALLLACGFEALRDLLQAVLFNRSACSCRGGPGKLTNKVPAQNSPSDGVVKSTQISIKEPPTVHFLECPGALNDDGLEYLTSKTSCCP